MGAIIGLVIGYVLGTRAGDKGFDELRDAWKTITTSEEVKDLLQGGLSMAGDAVQQGRSLLVERLAPPEPATGMPRAA